MLRVAHQIDFIRALVSLVGSHEAKERVLRCLGHDIGREICDRSHGGRRTGEMIGNGT